MAVDLGPFRTIWTFSTEVGFVFWEVKWTDIWRLPGSFHAGTPEGVEGYPPPAEAAQASYTEAVARFPDWVVELHQFSNEPRWVSYGVIIYKVNEGVTLFSAARTQAVIGTTWWLNQIPKMHREPTNSGPTGNGQLYSSGEAFTITDGPYRVDPDED